MIYPAKLNSNKKTIITLITIFSVVLISLFPTLFNGWVNWDDPGYVTENVLVSSGHISTDQIFTTPQVMGLYHPLTLLSLAIDYQIWGHHPFGFHLTNLLLHLFNTAFVFFLFRKLKSTLLVSGIVALLFGMHPMHVESVAWISGRKDVLYAFFLLIAALSYLRYLDGELKRKAHWYFLAIVFFILSLLSKNIAFVFPLLLILFDWKLGYPITKRTLLAKIPFFLLGAAALLIAFQGQADSDSLVTADTHSFSEGILFGSYNTVYYLFKSVIPIQLAAFHPFPMTAELSGFFYFSLLPLLLLIIVLLWAFKKHRNVFFGLVFYLVAIAPLVQIVPFGKALSSERYTYLAYIGLFYVLALSLEKLNGKYPNQKRIILGGFCFWISFLAFQTHQQSKVWKNSETLWNQVVDVHPDGYWAYFSRGLHYKKQQKKELAFEDFEKSIALTPSAEALYERGLMFEEMNDLLRAETDYRNSILLLPSNSKAHLNLGIILAKQRKIDPAISEFKKALKYDPNYSLAHFNYATALKFKGSFAKSLHHYDKAVELEPKNSQYLEFRAALQASSGNLDLAINDFQKALDLNPNNATVHFNLALLYEYQNNVSFAKNHAAKAVMLGYSIPEEKSYLLK